MTREKKHRLWSKVIEEAGQRVRIYEKRAGGPLWISVVTGRAKSASGESYSIRDRRSLGHRKKSQAEDQARALAKELAEATLSGRMGTTLTLGQLFAQYRAHRLPTLAPPRQREARARMTMLVECWSRDLDVLDITQTHIDEYVRKRRTLEIVAPGLREREDGTRPIGWRAPRPPRDGALHGELSALSTICNWATRYRVNGKRLLSENPLHGLEWPEEKNPRQPVASHSRYLKTQEHTDEIDPAARLRTILALARYTGRREDAICQLRANDILLNPDRVRASLAAEGLDENLAEHYPHGAIRWSPESDKEGYLFVTPLGSSAREALLAYLERNPCVGDVPLFPAPGDSTKPISRDRASKWLRRAEALAEVPKFNGGLWHPYRRLWASERDHLPDHVVAEAGGWRDTRALKKSYQAAKPADIARAVNLEP